MKRLHSLTIALLITSILATTASAAVTTLTGTVTGVTDGDTIRVLKDKTEIKVRLYAVDGVMSQTEISVR